MTLIPIGKSVNIAKSWEESDTTYIEGWLSTPDRDTQKDIVEPEAFTDAIDSYFARRAPISLSHGMKTLPVGHLQKAAILRDGKVLKTAVHPMDTADFTSLPATGTGVYVRGAINEDTARAAVHKGNVGAFSWVGLGDGEKLEGGGMRFTRVSPWLESTIAAYPVNAYTTFQIAKAYGYKEEEEEDDTTRHEEKESNDMTPEQIEAIVAAAITRLAPAPPPAAVVAKAFDEDAFLAKITSHVDGAIEAKLKRAEELTRGEGEGRKGTQNPAENEVQVAIRKAGANEKLTLEEKQMLNYLTVLGLQDGLSA